MDAPKEQNLVTAETVLTPQKCRIFLTFWKSESIQSCNFLASLIFDVVLNNETTMYIVLAK